MPGTGTSLAGNFILKSELAKLPVEQFNMFVIRGHIKTPANNFLSYIIFWIIIQIKKC